MAITSKTRASKQEYVSPSQGVLPCFELLFSGSLSPKSLGSSCGQDTLKCFSENLLQTDAQSSDRRQRH